MSQKIITLVIILISLGLLVAVVFGSKSQLDTSTQSAESLQAYTSPILFYGNSCPHCMDVEKWLKEEKADEKLSLIRLEVYDNRQNAGLMNQAASVCRLNTKSLGVPFIYDQSKCYMGVDEVMQYLKQALGKTEAK